MVSSVTETGFFFPKALPAAGSTKSMKNLHNIGKKFQRPKNIFFYKKVQLQYLLNDILDNSAENIAVWLRK